MQNVLGRMYCSGVVATFMTVLGVNAYHGVLLHRRLRRVDPFDPAFTFLKALGYAPLSWAFPAFVFHQVLIGEKHWKLHFVPNGLEKLDSTYDAETGDDICGIYNDFFYDIGVKQRK